MSGLIERLGKATKPSRDLDVDIWAAITDQRTYRRIPPGQGYSTWQIRRDAGGPWNDYYPSLNAKHYTASIDAALTLVPEGWTPHVIHFGVGEVSADICKKNNQLDDANGEHALPAIAICIAALRARGAALSENATA